MDYSLIGAAVLFSTYAAIIAITPRPKRTPFQFVVVDFLAAVVAFGLLGHYLSKYISAAFR